MAIKQLVMVRDWIQRRNFFFLLKKVIKFTNMQYPTINVIFTLKN